ncbi:hypothetical protein CCR75_004337 [Bremia lactucae]|uniref:Uncharacterized protein n=1 Tax=Bremia lactucae TaxID=4779 RepID=A0A976FJE2_BRELC|nr:hypothetical protein CCR75_004337 [Bremia lactucae]
MKFLLPPNTFSLVTLSPDHQQQILHEANTIVKEIIHANDAFTSNNATLSRQDWRLLRVKEGMHVSRQRKHATFQCTSPIFYPMVQSPSNQHVFSRYCTTSSSCSSMNAKVDTTTSLSTSSSLEYQRDTLMECMRPPHVPLMALHGSVDGTLDD